MGATHGRVTARERWYYRLLGADAELRRVVRPGQTVLDIGCSDGRGSVLLSAVGAFGVDIHRPALAVARQRDRRRVVVQADVRRLPFRGGAFDFCVALDVVEHLDKPEALDLIAEMERVGRTGVCILTPAGFVPQPPTPDEPWQEHRCGFTPKELSQLGYRVRGVGGARWLRAQYARVRGGLVGVGLAIASRPITRAWPSAAYHLFAVKDLRP